MENGPWSVMREHVPLSLLQQSENILECMVSKFGQECVSVSTILSILDKVAQ